jgi:spermidine dehydrogenase
LSTITRRNFINGTLMAAGAVVFPYGCTSDAVLTSLDPSYYPPALNGLRGSHPGSNTHAHSLAIEKKMNWGIPTQLKEEYDLIVVGGGISGLSAAYFYQQEHGRDKKVLILDNHDDFGGHARRNEHAINGNLPNGGSQTLVSPHARSKIVLDLLKNIGIDLDRFKTAYDINFYRNNELGAITYFNKERFGEDKIVKHPFSHYPWWVEGLPHPDISYEEAVQNSPLSEKGKEQLLRILNGGLHVLDLSKDRLQEYIYSHSYFDYLKTTLRIDDPQVLEIARTSCSDWAGGGADILSIGEALDCGALGFDPINEWKDIVGEKAFNESVKNHGNTFSADDPYIHHFPDGNATVARMLVKKMIPKVGEGDNAEEIVLSRFNYNELDKSDNDVRIRLNSTVIQVNHRGAASSSDDVLVTYINDNKSYEVTGKSVVMACYNRMIPYIIPDLPEEQSQALKRSEKKPIQYSTVGLKNWRGVKEIGMGMAMSPGNMHQVVMMDFPVSMGGYAFTKSPDDPCILQMIACPFGSTEGAPPIEQFREVRHKMLNLQFNHYEEEIRAHLSGMFPRDVFEFDRDVESITINRWAHGYVYGGSRLFDSDLREMAKIGRKPFGRTTIANIDSAPSAYAHVAIEQAWRAVQELG